MGRVGCRAGAGQKAQPVERLLRCMYCTAGIGLVGGSPPLRSPFTFSIVSLETCTAEQGPTTVDESGAIAGRQCGVQ